MKLNFVEIAKELTELQIKAADIHRYPDKYGVTKDIILKGQIVKDAINDYTSRVDQLVETELRPKLLELVPDSGFLGEETGTSGMDKKYRWIMDPTDGTADFSLGGEYYSNSTALIDRAANNGKGKVILGSVYQSAVDRQFLMIENDLLVREKIYFIDNTEEKKSKIIERIPEPSSSTCFPEYLGCAFSPTRYHKEYPGIEAKLKKVFEKENIPLLDRSYSMIDARPASGSSALFCSEIADGRRHFALLFLQSAWDLAVGAVYAQRAGCPVMLFNNEGQILNDADYKLETVIAHCDMDTKINVGVFGNEHIMNYVLKKFNS